jgi:tRNA 5-methylaminomethyl-2-thiouridine biosynthesis bifunctional protein
MSYPLKNSSPNNLTQASLGQASLNWDAQGQPKSEEFDDFYFNTDSGIDESRYVFINPTQLPQRWLDHKGSFTILETGFGTGLNFILTWLEWITFQSSKTETVNNNKCISNKDISNKENALSNNPHNQHVSNHLHFISIEKFPLDKAHIAQALALFPQLAHLTDQLITEYPLLIKGFHSLQFKDHNMTLTLIFDDISSALPQLTGPVDAWYLDGFAPAKNPDMWTDTLYSSMARLSRANTSMATFTAAGDVRRSLSACGFKLNKVPGFGMKRQMMHGTFIRSQGPIANQFDHIKPWLKPPTKIIKHVAIIGAGIAGCTTAYALARRGIKVTIIDKHGIATEASGNPQGAMYAKLAAGEATHSDIYVQGYLQSLRWLYQQLEPGDGWNNCGLIQLASTEKEVKRQQKFIEKTHYPKQLLHSITREEASNISGLTMNSGGLFFPEAGWVSPLRLCQQLVKHPLIELRKMTLSKLVNKNNDWQLMSPSDDHSQGNVNLTENTYSHVVIACANQSQKLLPNCYLPTKSIRGQLTYLDKDKCDRLMAYKAALTNTHTHTKSDVKDPQQTLNLKTVLCGKGYIAPADNGKYCLGASYNIKDDNTQLRLNDQHKNFAYLEDFGEEFQNLHMRLKEHDSTLLPGRTGFRCTTPDYLPMAGPLIDEEAFDSDFTAIRKNLQRYPRQAAKFHSGLYLNIGHGSRGLTSAPLCAELIAAYICEENFPLAKDHGEALLPARFLIREMVRNKR